MENLKSIDYKILWELVKNSRRSDRELAKILGISQPTVSRRRTILEKTLIDGYTAIPKWENLGYEVLAMTFVKIKAEIASKEKYETTRKKGSQWLMNQPNIIMAGACRGIGVDSFMISLHKNYSDYDDFMRDYRLELGDFINDVQSVLVNLAGKEVLKPLNLKYLAETQ
ncbi:MAG: Lrp/AsnC family transcriptional regulator [Candidatus Bathyarchaeia archaeon]